MAMQILRICFDKNQNPLVICPYFKNKESQLILFE